MTNQDGQDPQTRIWAQIMEPGRQMQRRASVLAVMSGLIWPLQSALVAIAIGGLLTGKDQSPFGAAIGFALLGLVRAILGYLSEMQSQAAAEAVVQLARTRIVSVEAGRAVDGAFGGAGSIAALASDKLGLLSPFVTRYAPAQARVRIVPLIILALSFWFSWAVGLVLLVTGPLIPLFMALVGMAAKEASARQMTEIGTLNDMLVERLSGLIDIRLLGAGDAVLTGFAAQANNLRSRTMAVLRVAFLSSTVLELFAAIGVAMVAVYVGFSLLGALSFGSWGRNLSPEAGIFLLLLAPEFYQPLRDLAAAWHDKAAAEAVISEIADWDAAGTPSLPGSGGVASPCPGPATVKLHNCVAPNGATLPDIDIAAGETVALIGPSGSGKTSTLRLMAGLERPDQGEICVAGQPLTDANANAWRARLGWMPQAPHFLSSSLQHNVSLGRKGDIGAALSAAAVAEVVDALPKRLHARLGESGAGLSGGEARRLTLARAIYSTPDVILADEPTADLDAKTAALVIEGLLAQAARGATLIVATHDMALAARMGRIIRIGDAL